MAINQKGQVTTTGLMGGEPKLPKAPDMSGLGQNVPQGGAKTAPVPTKTAGSPDQNIEERLQSLNEAEIAQLDGVLSPSNAAIFKKIAPEASTVIDQFTSEEEVVSLPVSTIVNYAMKIYGGDQQIAVQKFITDLSGEQPDNNNVPPGAAEGSQGMMAQQSPPETETSGANFDQIDQGLA
jgi:hypothetical protein